MKKARKLYSYAYYYWMRYLEPLFAIAIIGVGAVLTIRVAAMYGIFSFLGLWAFAKSLEKRENVEKPT